MWCIDDILKQKTEDGSQKSGGKHSGVHTLYISPLKALNNDIERNLRFPLHGIRDLMLQKGFSDPEISSQVRTGDTPSNVRSKMLKLPPDILITTPESLYLLLTNQKGRLLFNNLKYIIIDEIHAICSNKRGVHLSLSLERLMPLCTNIPVRIGLSATQRPLEKVAAYLGGFSATGTLNENQSFKPRPVNIIDTGRRKDLDLKVISPVENYSDLPEASVWPEVYKLLYRLIKEHKTTLVFATMRAQTEKIARILNEMHRQQTGDEAGEIALAHHGSQSRETRYEIEAKLKHAKIPAVIATGSLELGIDIGSIDLVIQLESPKTVSGALQRVGRSGHLLDAASKGRIIPLYKADLDDCAALTRAMLDGDIEETHIPENVLDVLAQQIVAEVAMQEWNYDALLGLMRQSYCYRNLPDNAYRRVIEMLSGKVTGQSLSALYPRINWDTVNNKLLARRGSQLTAILNGGTIPDRAYYAVYLQDQNVRLGEMEEEFVFESKIGDVFYLGNNEYRIDDIRKDRIIVTPRNEVKPRAPFWKGDLLYRDYQSHSRIGRFRAELQRHLNNDNPQIYLQDNFHLDEAIARNLLESYQQQMEHSGLVATDKQIIAEHFLDVSGEPLLLIQAPFGARVNGLWAIALAGILEDAHGLQVQYTFDDDAFIIRLLDAQNDAALTSILKSGVEKTEQVLLQKLIDSPIFAVHFRYNAARALMLPRSQPRKRIPLWLQRLRAADLLQVVKDIANFPVIAETYRELLYDHFDWPALQNILADIKNHDIKIRHINTMSPSPQASGLLFRMIADNMYEYDRSRQSSEGTINFNELLAGIISRENIPQVVTAEINNTFSARMQYLSPDSQIRDVEELYSMVEKLGPITFAEIDKRSGNKAADFFNTLKSDNRIIEISEPKAGWITADQKEYYQDPVNDAKAEFQLAKILQNDGVLDLTDLFTRCLLDETRIKTLLDKLQSENKIVSGKLLKNDNGLYYCDRYNFARMYRQAIAERRHIGVILERQVFEKFLFNWHFISEPLISIHDLFDRYQGCQFPAGFFNKNILTTRLSPNNLKQDFHECTNKGEVLIAVERAAGSSQTLERIIKRGSGNYFRFEEENDQNHSAEEQLILKFLKENGASFFNDIVDATESGAVAVQKKLSKLVLSGLVTNDDYSTLQSLVQGKKPSASSPASSLSGMRSQRRPSRGQAMRTFIERDKLRNGRWFMTNAFAVSGKKRSRDEQAEYQARMLLNRYGIVVKEWYRHETGLLPWIHIFNALKKLEWQGEIYRGYFIKGLSGLQFALPDALHKLETVNNETSFDVLLSTIDPALPFGKAVSWQIFDPDNNEIKIIRRENNYLFIRNSLFKLYLESNFSRIFLCKDFEPADADVFLAQLKNWFKQNPDQGLRKIEIKSINGITPAESEWLDVLLAHGFEKNGSELVLWPSAV